LENQSQKYSEQELRLNRLFTDFQIRLDANSPIPYLLITKY